MLTAATAKQKDRAIAKKVSVVSIQAADSFSAGGSFKCSVCGKSKDKDATSLHVDEDREGVVTKTCSQCHMKAKP